jgi:hypothetical protein
MLNFYDFCLLPTDEQSDFILDNGQFLCSIDVKDNKIGLFFLFDFYVEVYYNYTCKSLVKITPFRDAKHLDPYLKHIKLPQLAY